MALNRLLMLRRVFSVMLLLLFIAGAFRWDVAQVRMYGRMLAERSADSPLLEAIESTFSGRAPCGNCLKITRERSRAGSESYVSRDPGLSGHWCMLSGPALEAPQEKTLKRESQFVQVYVSPLTRPAAPPPRSLRIV